MKKKEQCVQTDWNKVLEQAVKERNAVELLEAWKNGSKGRWCNICFDGYYGSQWQVKLGNYDVPCPDNWLYRENAKEHGVAYAAEIPYFDTLGDPENVVHITESLDKDDRPGLAKTIVAALERAEKLGI